MNYYTVLHITLSIMLGVGLGYLLKNELEVQNVIYHMIENSPLIVFIKDKDFNYIKTNKNFKTLFNVPSKGSRYSLKEKELVLRDEDLFPNDIVNRLRASDREALSGKSKVVEEILLHPDGTSHVYLSHKFPLYKGLRNKPYALCGISLNISEKRRALLELERLNIAKYDFINNISHELRTPLSNIKLSTKLLKLTLGDLSAKNKEYLNILETECEKEIKLVNSLLSIQKINYSDLNKEEVKVYDWVQQIVTPLQVIAASRDQELNINIENTKVVLLFLPKELCEKIIYELLINAINYTESKKRIDFSLEVDDTNFHLKISNTSNVTEEDITIMFDKFTRIKKTDYWKEQGAGLSLNLVKVLVQRMEGNISAYKTGDFLSIEVNIPLPIKINNSFLSYI